MEGKTAIIKRPIPPSVMGTIKARKPGEQCVIIREYKDGLGRLLLRAAFPDGELRVLLEGDIEYVE